MTEDFVQMLIDRLEKDPELRDRFRAALFGEADPDQIKSDEKKQ